MLHGLYTLQREYEHRKGRLTPTAPPKNFADCNTMLCTVAVLTLQLSLPVTQLLVPFALEQVCT
jgi:hypothetical protein